MSADEAKSYGLVDAVLEQRPVDSVKTAWIGPVRTRPPAGFRPHAPGPG